jgi:hypothetical protein
MTMSQRLYRLAKKLTDIAARLEATSPAPAARSIPSVEHVTDSLGGQVALLESMVSSAPEQPPRGRMLVDPGSGRRGRRCF